MIQSWSDTMKGVEVKQSGFNDASITYNGLLARSGADKVYLHCGSGDPKSWRNVSTVCMDRTARGWESTQRMAEPMLNFCFKDSANHWDNNNGYNWTIRA